jgi:hypothetical protein
LARKKDPAAVTLGRKGGREIAKRGADYFRIRWKFWLTISWFSLLLNIGYLLGAARHPEMSHSTPEGLVYVLAYAVASLFTPLEFFLSVCLMVILWPPRRLFRFLLRRS